MSNATPISAESMLQQLSIHKEIAQGAIKVSPNPADVGLAAPSFSRLMQNKVSAINTEQNASSALMRAVDAGESDDLVGAMVAAQKAGLSFSAMLQIRNRLVQAFDEVMKMPI